MAFPQIEANELDHHTPQDIYYTKENVFMTKVLRSMDL
jgi:hypothetical protein